MKAIFTQAGPGLSISQGGLGPIVQLGFGRAGAPATLSNAPPVTSLQSSDKLLLSRAGQLFSVTWPELLALIAAAIGAPTQPGSPIMVSFDFDQPGGIPALFFL